MTANNEHRNNKKKRDDGDKKRAKQPQLQKKKKLGKLALQDQKIQELERCIQVRILQAAKKPTGILFTFDSIILSPSLSVCPF